MKNGEKKRSRRKVIAIIALIILTIIAVVLAKIVQLFRPPSKLASKPSLKTEPVTVVTVDNQGKKTQRRQEIKYYTEDLGNGVNLYMVSIPGDVFKMGSPNDELGRTNNEGPQHNVIVKSFYMGMSPVTQKQWEEVAKLPQLKLLLNPKPSTFGDNSPSDSNLPVETISWEEANEFCERLTQKFGRKYRLPSEAEWEYACRAKTTTPFHFGDTITPELANYDVNYAYGYGPKGTKEQYEGQTIPVNRNHPPNAFGLESMHGNVWEWCADSYQENYDNAPKDGSPWENKDSPNRVIPDRVIRGGAWHNFPTSCRSATRNYKPQNIKTNSIGFRVVCDYS